MLSVNSILKANEKLKGIVTKTPLEKSSNLSLEHSANIWLKREDLQIIRSYKLRGAYNLISSLSNEETKNGVICASAGNHAQGVAYACRKLGIKGKIYMPVITPSQKVKQVEMFGKDSIEIIFHGDCFDDAYEAALETSVKQDIFFIHPFDDERIISGQGTVGIEIMQDVNFTIDYLFVPIGGGGLASGLITYLKQISPNTKIIGVEPEGAASMKKSIEMNEVVTLDKIERFVDGAAVRRVGNLTFNICKDGLDDILVIPEGHVCSKILKLYNEEAIVAEPAGVLSICALDLYKDKIKNKNVMCIVSGGNNDISRMEEIKERAQLFEGLKHYFIVRFPQRAGALREFLNNVLGPNDDISTFQYTKKNSRENGPALIGIELQKSEDYNPLINRMDKHKIVYEYLNCKSDLFQYII
jgi:threonine dehydratase